MADYFSKVVCTHCGKRRAFGIDHTECSKAMQKLNEGNKRRKRNNKVTEKYIDELTKYLENKE